MRIIAMLLLAVAPALAAAQDVPTRVGRIAHIEGSAAIYRDPDLGWDQAWVNSPVTSENSIWTEPESRAELRVGGTAVRMNEATQLDVARLDDDELDAFVPRGTVSVRVRHLDPRQERIVFNTPYAQFRIGSDGRYRIDVDPDREEARITVFQGDARVGSESGNVRVGSGETVRIFGGPNPEYVTERAYGDPFDRWADSRDRSWVETRSTQYVSPYMTGYEDLDYYGSWNSEPDYGGVWYPRNVAADWAPYRYGHWGNVQPWGWTWIDDAPWGYAPFHYGRWVYVGNRWGWVPGQREVRPVWAPALVAWIGGSNFSVGVSGGAPVGWYPLSPWDRYQPWYRASNAHVTNVNVIVNNYASRPAPEQVRMMMRERGATVVNREAMVDRRRVQDARVRIAPEALRSAAAVAQPTQLLPTRNEYVQRRTSVRTESAAAARANAATGQKEGAAASGSPSKGAIIGGAAAVAGAAALVARPNFGKERTAAAPAPQPATSAPPPPKPVTAPTAQAKEQARAERMKQLEARKEAPAAGRPQQPGSAPTAQQQPPQPGAERAQREEQQRTHEAQQQQLQQQKQQQAQERAQQQQQKQQQQAQERSQQQQQKQQQQAQERSQRDEQQRAREAQQQQQQQQQQQKQQQAQERTQRDEQQRAREAQQQQQQQQKQQQAQERAQREQQAAQERAQRAQAQQQQAQERAQKAAEQQQPQQQQQQQQQREQAQAQQRAQKEQQRQEKSKSEKDKDKDDDKKKP